LLGCIERPASREDRESAEQYAFAIIQEAVAQIDCGAERLLSSRSGATSRA
jgi:hypothetical protein